jgi:hypothetical protein
MHFRQKRRVRSAWDKQTDVPSWLTCKSGNYGYSMASPHGTRSITTSVVRFRYGVCASRLHCIRCSIIEGLSEKELVALYFESQEDPWMREKIADYCTTDVDLRHITAEYLDRVAKLKLFL